MKEFSVYQLQKRKDPSSRKTKQRRIEDAISRLWQKGHNDFSFRQDAFTQPEIALMTGESGVASPWERMIAALWLYAPSNPHGFDYSLGYVDETYVR